MASSGVWLAAELIGDGVDGGGAGSAEDESDSVEEEGCGEGAEQEVLEGGFGSLGALAAQAGKDVGRDR